jgi:hypothetical protein
MLIGELNELDGRLKSTQKLFEETYWNQRARIQQILFSLVSRLRVSFLKIFMPLLL